MNEVAKEIVNHGPRIVHKAWKDPTKELLDSCEQRKEQIIKEQMAKFIILKRHPRETHTRGGGGTTRCKKSKRKGKENNNNP